MLDSGHDAPVDRAAFYVGISRARDNAVVLTDNREDLVEALEDHAGLPMTALEAVGEEIAPPVPLPIPEREAVWPELSAWRALEEAARQQGTIPFYVDGCTEAVERLTELGRAPGISADVAAEAERAAEAHDAASAARATLDRLHEGLEAEIAGRAGLTDGTGERGRDYVFWCEAALKLSAEADGIAGEEDRYRPHLDALPAVRDGIAEAGGKLKGMLDADNVVLPVLDEWRKLDEHAKEAGTHWFHEDGREDVLGRMEAMPDLRHMDATLREGLAAIVAEGRGIAAAEDKFRPLAARLRDCVEERERLIEATGEARATYSLHPGLAAWREEAGSLLEEARDLLDADGSFAHAGALPDLRDGIAEDRELLKGAVSLDGRHAACVRERLEVVRRETGTPLFYREGNGEAVAGMRVLAAEPELNGDARALFDRLVAEHDREAAAHSEVERLVRDLGSSLDQRKHLSDVTAPRGRSLTEDGASYRFWSEEARRLCKTAERILAEDRYAVHLDRIEGAREDIGRDGKRLSQALETDTAYGKIAPKLGRYDLGGPERIRVAGEARRLLDRPELDPGARTKLERQVAIHDAARRRDRSRDIGGGMTP